MTSTATANKVQLLRKITMSEVFGLARASNGFKPVRDFGAKMNTETGVLEPYAPFLIARIVGVVRNATEKTTDFGPYIEFSGNFGATNAKGQQFRAPKCILPEPAQSMLADALASAGEGNAVELAFDFHAAYDTGDRGYKYTCTPLMKQPEEDPVARLSASVNEQFALPAPKADAQPELPGTEATEGTPEEKPAKKAK